MKALVVLFCLCVLMHASFAKVVSLTSKDGRTIRVSMDNYFPDKGLVAARMNGQGKVITFQKDLLDDESIAFVESWYQRYSIRNLLRFEVVREPGEEKGTCHFAVETVSASNEPIKDIRIEYSIAYKERYLEEVESKNSKKKKYEEAESRATFEGVQFIETIAARGQIDFTTEAIATENVQSITFSKDKGPEEVRNKNSVQGVYMKVFSGDLLVREVESKPGIKQLVEQYSRG